MVRARSATGISAATWLLFGFANVAIYVYTERCDAWQALVGILFIAVPGFVIVGWAPFFATRVRQARSWCPGNRRMRLSL